MWPPLRLKTRRRNPGRDQEIARENITVGQLSHDLNSASTPNSSWSSRSAAACDVSPGIDGPAGQADLAAMMGQRLGPLRQRQIPTVLATKQQQQHGGRAGPCAAPARMPAVAQLRRQRTPRGVPRSPPRSAAASRSGKSAAVVKASIFDAVNDIFIVPKRDRQLEQLPAIREHILSVIFSGQLVHATRCPTRRPNRPTAACRRTRS